MDILTKELVEEAIGMARPSIEAILKNDQCVWGPRYVVIAATTHLDGSNKFWSVNLQEGSWDSNWPSEAHFARLAVVKMNLARQEGLTTGVIVTQKPWILTTGDCLYRGGVAEEPNSIAVGASGLKAEADEGVAWIVFGFITMLCHLRVRDLRAQERETL